MVSDIDDTVIVTVLPQPLVAFRNAFLLMRAPGRPVAGMAELYADVAAAHPDVFVVYLSTGAWNTAGALGRFLHHHGFPRGPLLLTDWGPTTSAWFRSGREHKRAQLRRLLEELPDLTWLLVGDDGQHDPTTYAELAARAPDRVAAIAIRELSLGEQVVGHGTPVARDEPGHGPGRRGARSRRLRPARPRSATTGLSPPRTGTAHQVHVVGAACAPRPGRRARPAR